MTVRWIRSGYDALGVAQIRDYVIQRSLPPGTSGFAWENIATLPATQDPVYSYTAATLYDSSASTKGALFFRVLARTANPLEFWKSPPVAGYSVDNLSPAATQFVAALALPDLSVKLTWKKNRLDPDVRHYAIYRSTTDGFIPAPNLQIGAPTDTTLIDRNPVLGARNYYRAVTFDIHGNASKPSSQIAVLLTGVKEQAESLPAEFALLQNYPNPFNPATTIRFALPKAVSVTLKIFDAHGREVATLMDKKLLPGFHQVIFDAHGLPSGVYFYQLRAGSFLQQKKLAVVK